MGKKTNPGTNRPLQLLKWTAGALAFGGACWLVTSSEDWRARLVSNLPSWIELFWQKGTKTLVEVLPPQPVDIAAAFKLGELAEQLRNYTSTGQNVTGLLAQAGKLVKGAGLPLTAEQLAALPEAIFAMQDERGIISRVLGIFTLTNILWTASIGTIGVAALPFIVTAIGPLAGWLAATVIVFYENVIDPTARFLHRTGVLEALAWTLPMITLADAFRVPPETGTFVALTAVMAACVAGTYSTLRHAEDLWSDFGWVAPAWLAASLAPLAYHFESSLLAYLSVGSFWWALRFSAFVDRLSLHIGFRNEADMMRVCSTSSFVLVGFTFFKAMIGRTGNFSVDRISDVFGSPVAVMGSLSLSIGLLIYSSFWNSKQTTYTQRNVHALGAFAAMMAAGFVFAPSSGLGKTATTFFTLWLAEKYAELHLSNGWNVWGFLLVMGGLGYKGALWMHNNPQLIYDLLKN